LFGVNDTTLRSLPACLGVLTLPVTYLVWRPLIGRRAAGLALALLSLSAYHVMYSLDAKMYAAVWILATLSCGSFLNLLQSETRWHAWLLLYGLSTSCLPLVNYTAIAVVFVQVVFGLGLFATRPLRRPRIVGSWLVLFLAMVPFIAWIPIIRDAARYRYEVGWVEQTIPARIPRGIVRLFSNFLLGCEFTGAHRLRLSWSLLFDLIQLPLVLVTLGFLAYSLTGVLRPVRRGARREGEGDERSARAEVLMFLALWVTLPVVGCIAYSLCFQPLWGVPRYLISSAAGLLLWLASALDQRRGKRLAFAGLVSVLGANLLVIAFDRIHDTRIDWRMAARTIGAVSTAIDFHDRAGRDVGLGSRGRPPAMVVMNAPYSRGYSLTLAHAAFTEGVAFEVVTLEHAIASRREFYFVDTKREWPAPDDSVPEKLTPAVAEFHCRVIFAKSYYEVPGDCIAPRLRRFLDIWLCSPRDRVPSAIHDEGTLRNRNISTSSERTTHKSDAGRVYPLEQTHEP
jgi:hypothetical protein